MAAVVPACGRWEPKVLGGECVFQGLDLPVAPGPIHEGLPNEVPRSTHSRAGIEDMLQLDAGFYRYKDLPQTVQDPLTLPSTAQDDSFGARKDEGPHSEEIKKIARASKKKVDPMFPTLPPYNGNNGSALITGGLGGLGLLTAINCVERGDKFLKLVSRRDTIPDDALPLWERLKESSVTIVRERADVSIREDVQRIFQDSNERPHC